MKKQWQEGNENFLKMTSREQYLILITGLVAVFFIIFYLFIDNKMASTNNANKKIAQLSSSNQSLKISVLEVQAALQGDPNEEVRSQISQYQDKLAQIDDSLLKLTSDLMSPIQMRYALLDLLKLEKGVSLLSFELLGAQPLLSDNAVSSSTDNLSANTTIDVTEMNDNSSGVNLYRHGIKIKLSGRYFELRDYLTQLEKLPWKFFWQGFNFTLTEYPNSELEIEMYSLGTKKEFIGV